MEVLASNEQNAVEEIEALTYDEASTEPRPLFRPAAAPIRFLEIGRRSVFSADRLDGEEVAEAGSPADITADEILEQFQAWESAEGAARIAQEEPPGQPQEPQRDQEGALAEREALEMRLAAERREAEERARGEGFAMGLERGREEAGNQVKQERDRLRDQASSLLESAAISRDVYFHRLEQETVQLALAIAVRILRREAQSDPLLLTGAVRVALGQLAASTEVRLHVPAQDESMWREAFASMPGLAHRPRVIGEPEMELGECRMETELGSADLGLWPQLKAIERSLFERSEDFSKPIPHDQGEAGPDVIATNHSGGQIYAGNAWASSQVAEEEDGILSE